MPKTSAAFAGLESSQLLRAQTVCCLMANFALRNSNVACSLCLGETASSGQGALVCSVCPLNSAPNADHTVRCKPSFISSNFVVFAAMRLQNRLLHYDSKRDRERAASVHHLVQQLPC